MTAPQTLPSVEPRKNHLKRFDLFCLKARDERVGVGGADGAVERPLLAVPILRE